MQQKTSTSVTLLLWFTFVLETNPTTVFILTNNKIMTCVLFVCLNSYLISGVAKNLVIEKWGHKWKKFKKPCSRRLFYVFRCKKFFYFRTFSYFFFHIIYLDILKPNILIFLKFLLVVIFIQPIGILKFVCLHTIYNILYVTS